MITANVNPSHLLSELRLLAAHEGANSISILMPSHAAGAEAQQAPIRLRDPIEATERDLVERSAGSVEARRRLSGAKALLDDAAFWREQGHGLDFFIGDDLFKVYRTPIRLPELHHVEIRFHFRPVM